MAKLTNREVVEALKDRGLSPAGKIDELRQRLADAVAAGAPPGVDAETGEVTDASDTVPEKPTSASDATGDDSPPAPAEAATAPQKLSTKAQAVKRAKTAVDEMDDEQVTEMVLAYEKDPIEDMPSRRGQLMGLLVEEWEAEQAVKP